jgi:hypothetical protein
VPQIIGDSVRTVSDQFPSLTVTDLLEARDAYHVHLSSIRTVVATAIGRFREKVDYRGEASIRPSDWKPREIKEPRTLANSVLTDDSWPCVLVFVNRWFSREELRRQRTFDLLVPPRLYLSDGRVIPTCVIYVEEVVTRASPLREFRFPAGLLGGGLSNSYRRPNGRACRVDRLLGVRR